MGGAGVFMGAGADGSGGGGCDTVVLTGSVSAPGHEELEPFSTYLTDRNIFIIKINPTRM